MKKILFFAAVLLSANATKTYAQQSLEIVNNTSCVANVQVFAHDGVSYTGCGVLTSGFFSIGALGSVTYSDVGVLNACGGNPEWQIHCFGMGPKADGLSGLWDDVAISFGGLGLADTYPSGSCFGSTPATTVACPNTCSLSLSYSLNWSTTLTGWLLTIN